MLQLLLGLPLIGRFLFAFSIWEFVKSAKTWMRVFYDEKILANPIISSFFWISLIVFFCVVFYEQGTKLLGIKRSKFADKLVVWSLPFLLFTIIGYTAYTQLSVHQDDLYKIYYDVKNKDDLIAVNHLNRVNHNVNAKKDPNYLFKAIKNGYIAEVYQDIVSNLGSSFLNSKNSRKRTALVEAVLQRNTPALLALTQSDYVDLKVEVPYEKQTVQGLFGSLFSKKDKGKYNAYQIAMYEQQPQLAGIIKAEGLRRGWAYWSEINEKL